jgi:hypothetical protein
MIVSYGREGKSGNGTAYPNGVGIDPVIVYYFWSTFLFILLHFTILFDSRSDYFVTLGIFILDRAELSVCLYPFFFPGKGVKGVKGESRGMGSLVWLSINK